MSAVAHSARRAAERSNRLATDLDGLFSRLVAELRAVHGRMACSAPASGASAQIG